LIPSVWLFLPLRGPKTKHRFSNTFAQPFPPTSFLCSFAYPLFFPFFLASFYPAVPVFCFLGSPIGLQLLFPLPIPLFPPWANFCVGNKVRRQADAPAAFFSFPSTRCFFSDLGTTTAVSSILQCTCVSFVLLLYFSSIGSSLLPIPNPQYARIFRL